MVDVPSNRAVILRGHLIKETPDVHENRAKKDISKGQIARELVPLVVAQWQKANAKFCSPVTISENSVVKRVEKLLERVQDVASGRTNQKEK